MPGRAKRRKGNGNGILDRLQVVLVGHVSRVGTGDNGSAEEHVENHLTADEDRGGGDDELEHRATLAVSELGHTSPSSPG